MQQRRNRTFCHLGDDIGMWNISAYSHGMMGYPTPNIDRIAAEGSCSPIVTASRAVPRGVRPSSPGKAFSARVEQGRDAGSGYWPARRRSHHR